MEQPFVQHHSIRLENVYGERFPNLCDGALMTMTVSPFRYRRSVRPSLRIALTVTFGPPPERIAEQDLGDIPAWSCIPTVNPALTMQLLSCGHRNGHRPM